MKYFCLAVLSLLCFLHFACRTSKDAGNPNIQASPLEVKVMTFNIRYYRAKDGPDDWVYRRRMVVDVIRNARVDAVGLQEAEKPQVDWLVNELREFGNLTTYSDGKTEGHSNTLLYRTSRFEVDCWDTFWLSDAPAEPGSKGWGNKHPRFCTWARLVEKKTGKAFYFFNVHLDHESQYSRERGAVLVTKMISERKHNDPFVLTGDMNAEEGNSAIAFFKGNELAIEGTSYVNQVPLVDTFRVKHGSQVDAGTFNGFGDREKFNKIDYVFSQEPFQVLDAEVVKYNENGHYPSDHCPVVASLRFPERPVVNKEYKSE